MSPNNRHCHSNMSRHRSKRTEISVIRRQRVKGSLRILKDLHVDLHEDLNKDLQGS